MQTQMQKQKDKKMQNLHLFVSTAKPEGSSGGENEEQKRGVVVGAVHPSAALARQRVTALDILKGFNASTEYEVHSVYMQRLWHNTPFSSYRTIFTSNVDRTATRSSVILGWLLGMSNLIAKTCSRSLDYVPYDGLHS